MKDKIEILMNEDLLSLNEQSIAHVKKVKN